MCQLCKLQPVSKLQSSESEEESLKKVGSVRRRLIHKKRSTGKKNRLSDRLRTREWRVIENRKIRSENKLERTLQNLFEEEIQLLVNRLKDKAGVKSVYWAKHKIMNGRKAEEILPTIVNILLDWAAWFDRTKSEMKPILDQIAEEGFETGLNRIGTQGPDFTSSQPVVRTTLDEILEQAGRTQDTFKEIAARQIQKGLSDGDSMQGIVARVADKTEEQIGFRLDRIVQTAGNGAFESGQRESWRKAGINKIDWLTQRDPKVRSPVVGDIWNHREMDRQVVRIEEKFTVTGRGGRSEKLWHPSDPNGSPGNVIYCRCSTTPAE